MAVGAVVLNLGRAEVEDSAQCPVSIGLKLAVIGGQDELCYDSAKKELRFTVENGANIKIEGLTVNIIGTQKAETFELNDAKIPKVGTYLGKAAYDSAIDGNIRQVKIIPKVVLYDAEQICTEGTLTLENVRAC